MDTKGNLLPNGPLTVVLAQIRFTPIMHIATYIPQIQDRLRKKGYPFSDTLQGQSFHPRPNGEIERTAVTQWILSSPQYARNIIIDNDQLIFQIFDTHTYQFHDYMKEFMEILHIFDNVVNLSIITRFGLRYVNAIAEHKDSSWKTLVNNQFHDITFPVNHDWIDNALSSIVVQRGLNLKRSNLKSNFLLRLYQQADSRKYPPDILRIMTEENGNSDRFAQAKLVTFLDLDHFILLRESPKKDFFERFPILFDELHAAIEDVFYHTLITKEAIRQWS